MAAMWGLINLLHIVYATVCAVHVHSIFLFTLALCTKQFIELVTDTPLGIGGRAFLLPNASMKTVGPVGPPQPTQKHFVGAQLLSTKHLSNL